MIKCKKGGRRWSPARRKGEEDGLGFLFHLSSNKMEKKVVLGPTSNQIRVKTPRTPPHARRHVDPCEVHLDLIYLVLTQFEPIEDI